MRKRGKALSLLAAVSLIGGVVAAGSASATTEPPGTEPAGTEAAGTDPAAVAVTSAVRCDNP